MKIKRIKRLLESLNESEIKQLNRVLKEEKNWEAAAAKNAVLCIIKKIEWEMLSKDTQTMLKGKEDIIKYLKKNESEIQEVLDGRRELLAFTMNSILRGRVGEYKINVEMNVDERIKGHAIIKIQIFESIAVRGGTVCRTEDFGITWK